MSRYQAVEIQLIERSTAGGQPRVLPGQTCDIQLGGSENSTGVDGMTSTARLPTKIVWHEGKADWFGRNPTTGMYAVTNVRIKASNGQPLIDDWELCPNAGVPRDTAQGVEFHVLQPDP